MVIRPGDNRAGMDLLAGLTPAERISLVWELTLQCLAWRENKLVEPRLQRSVVHIQRAWR